MTICELLRVGSSKTAAALQEPSRLEAKPRARHGSGLRCVDRKELRHRVQASQVGVAHQHVTHQEAPQGLRRLQAHGTKLKAALKLTFLSGFRSKGLVKHSETVTPPVCLHIRSGRLE